jgi:hypothetical protein
MTGQWKVAVDGEETRALYEPAAQGAEQALFVCAHGAGGHMEDRGMARLAGTLREQGVGVVRFNFLYREKGSRRPDPMPLLQRCLAAVAGRARGELAPRRLLLGGRSMGARAASMMAADGFACDGLLLAAYPLHPAGKPEALRDAHLPRIRVPVLCVNGTRDALCRRDLMERALAGVRAPWVMHWLEGADHSFRVLKSSGRSEADVYAEVGEASRRWLAGESFREK